MISATSAETKDAYFLRPRVVIAQETLRSLIEAGVDPLVARVDLESAKLLLVVKSGWTEQRANLAEVEYKRFLSLHLWNRSLPYPLVPTVLIDTLWHAHILDTRAYVDDTSRLFGSYLHHFPYLGFLDEESKRLKQEAFEKFCALYEWTFGESYLRSAVALHDLS